MADDPDSLEERTRKLQAAYDEFMKTMLGLEQEKLEVMKRVIGALEKEEIEQLLNDLKRP
jgi:hypothetical protein